MKKTFLNLFFLTFCLISFSQSGTSSPYSFYGVGTNTFKGSIDNRSMGGLSVYSDSIHLNLTNPASFSELKRVNYSLGITYDDLTFKSENANENSNSSNVNYLAVGIPTKYFTFGFGVIPKTSVGYMLENTNESVVPSIVDRYRGEGGVNTAFLTFGFKVFKKIGVGITTNYEFGNLNHITTRFLEDVELATRIESNSSLSGINNVYSLLFREKISKQLTFHATYILSQEFNLGSNNTQTLSTYSVTNQYGGDVEEIDLASMNLEKTEITVPKSQTIGLGLGVETKWFVGAEFQQKDGGGLDNKLFSLENVDFQKGSRFSLGGFYIPKYDSFTSYFSTIVYRAGLRIEDTGLNIQGQAIKEVGFNFGFGIPFQGFSNLNLGFEIGKRGTTNSGLIEENFFSVRLGMSKYYSTEYSDDLIGVEVCAATKNIYSMLIGASEGLSSEVLSDEIKKKYYLNTAASLVYKAVSEMKYLTKKLKGKPETAYGLAGLGDLHVSSAGGRNSKMGYYLGQGYTFKDAKENYMKEITVEGADLAFAIGPKILDEFDKNEFPLMFSILNSICYNNKLNIDW